ncbi:MAG: SUMF1/EgtB/PvdO family nonheme iron enzyme [Pseudomonadota bacterium]
MIAFIYTQPILAAGLDQAFTKPETAETWGERLAASIGYEGFAKSYALVVGISDYPGGYGDLPTSEDATRMAEFLFEEAGFDHVHILTEERATRDRVAELMSEEFPKLVKANDRFLFYWSGHGDTRDIPQGRRKAGYLPFYDTPPGRWSRMIAMEDIQRWSDFLNAHQSLFLLDACFSGLAGLAQKSTPQEWTVQRLAQRGHHLMSAGTDEETTIAGDRWQGSLFTYAVLEGLQGAADSLPKDGIVTLTELKAYVQDKVLFERRTARHESEITPQLRDLQHNSGEFFFLTGERVDLGETIQPSPFPDDTAEKGNGEQSSDQETAGLPTNQSESSSTRPVIGPSSYDPLTSFRDCETCPEMLVIPAGAFFMGSRSSEPGSSDHERSRHKVNVESFAIGKYEVTFDEWDACVEAGACDHRPDDQSWGRGKRPVINVSWNDAKQYATWLSGQTGVTYRLPREAEWEYAARAFPTSKGPNAPAYAFGNTITQQQANFGGLVGQTTDVGSYLANAWLLHDMHGNVWEWVEDRWDETYDARVRRQRDERQQEIRGEVVSSDISAIPRVLRGGTWLSLAEEVRSANRSAQHPDNRDKKIGFRVARTLTP